MNLSQKTWFVRYFLWCCLVLDHFIPKRMYKRYEDYQKGTNLCHFFQTLMWGSFITFLFGCLYSIIFFDIFVLPFILFGTISYIISVIIVLSIAAGIIALIFAIGYGIFFLEEFLERKKEDQKPKTNLSGLFVWYMAVKNHFCPTISFNSGDDHE